MAFFKRKRMTARAARGKSTVPDGLWMKCDGCQGTVFRREVEQNLMVCPACGYHYRLGVAERLEQLLDPGTFEETNTTLRAADPLHFTIGKETYIDRIERAKEESGLEDALTTGYIIIEDLNMLTKEKVKKTIDRLPDSFTVDQLVEELVVLDKIEKGLKEVEEGKVYSTQQVKDQLKKWL